MKQTTIVILNAVSLVIILSACNFWNGLVMFLLAGVIPGTSIVLPPSAMMLLITLIILSGAYFTFHETETKKEIKPSLPRKRYGQI